MINIEALRQSSWFDQQAYPFASHFLERPGGRLHYLDQGQGPAVLLVHGTPGWSYEWRALVGALLPHHRVIAPDHLGFGLSDRPARARFSYSLADHTANLRALVDALGVERLTLVVHDFGGPIGLPLALDQHLGQRGRIERLALLNTWMWPFSLDPEFARRRRMVGSGLMRWLYRNLNFSAGYMVKYGWGRRAPLDRRAHDQFKKMFPDAASREGTLGFLRAMVDEDAYLESLWARRQALRALPAIVFWGMADRAVKPLHLERWRETLRDDAELHRFDDVGHWPHEEAAAEVAAALARFCASSA